MKIPPLLLPALVGVGLVFFAGLGAGRASESSKLDDFVRLLRKDAGQVVFSYLAAQRPGSPMGVSEKGVIDEVLGREIGIQREGGEQTPKTLVQFLKKQGRKDEGKERARELENLASSGGGSTGRAEAQALLRSMMEESFDRIREDLLLRAAGRGELGSTLSADALQDIVLRYWWARQRLEVFE